MLRDMRDGLDERAAGPRRAPGRARRPL